MSRNSTTREQKPKTPLYGRKAREARRRDNTRWMNCDGSCCNKKYLVDNRQELAATAEWTANATQLMSAEPGVIVVTDSRPLDRDQQLAAHTESDNYQVDHYAYLEHPVTGKAKAYLISGGVTTEAVSTGVPYPNVDFIRRGGHAKLIG